MFCHNIIKLSDQVEGELDFAKEVSKISDSVEQQLEKAAEDVRDIESLEESTDQEIREEEAGKGSKDLDVRNSLNEDGTLPVNALDLRLPVALNRKLYQPLKLKG